MVTSEEGISFTTPSLLTFAVGADNTLRLSRDCSALTVWTVPKTALMVITIRMTAVLSISPKKPDTTAAMIKMMTRKSLNCSKRAVSGIFSCLQPAG